MSNEEQDSEVELFREPGEGEEELPARPVGPPKILAVSGAKGGVGKTILTANLAVYVASLGRKVIAVDADVQGANLHTVLGVGQPRRRVRPERPLEEHEEEIVTPVIVESAISGLRYYHAGLDEPALGETRRVRVSRLRDRLEQLPADFVVVDLGSGRDPALIDLFLTADMSVFVGLPEPTAIANTYRFLRYAFVRFITHRTASRDERARLRFKIQELGEAPSPVDIWRRLEDDGDPLADLVRVSMNTFRPVLALNQTRLRADLELGEAMRTAVRRAFGIDVDYVGYIDYDDTVWNCVRTSRLLLVESPGAKAAKAIEKVARRLLGAARGESRRGRSVPPESHHDLLEVDRGATDEEVRRAYKRVKEIYAPDSICCYGLFTDEEQEAVRARLDEAFDVLLDPARRRPYERSVFPLDSDGDDEDDGVGPNDAALPLMPAITPDTDFNGPLLKQVRQAHGLALKSISQKTKVGLGFLKAIEMDDFARLPAPVYVRGFVTELAKCLQLDAAHVSRTYVKRYQRYLDGRK